jgi:3-oxoadipate enol-lactonase
LIHGFPLTSAIWEAQENVLSRSSYLLRLDLRGAGSSSVPDGPYLMETLAADVAAVLDALSVERAALIGHSMGGYVALAFVRMFTERVTRLGLVTSRLRADTTQEAAARNGLAERIEADDSVEPAIEAYLPRLLAPQSCDRKVGVVERAYKIARKNTPAGAAATLRGMALRASSEDIAEELGVPMLFIAGACDRVVSLDEARSVAASFPRGRLVVCNESGHLPMMEEPRRVSGALEAFLAEPA